MDMSSSPIMSILFILVSFALIFFVLKDRDPKEASEEDLETLIKNNKEREDNVIKREEQFSQQIYSIVKAKLNTDSHNILIRPDQSARLTENFHEKGYIITFNKTDYYLGILKDEEDIKVTKWVELNGNNYYETNDQVGE